MPSEAPPAARLVGVGHRYGTTVALDHIDIDVPAGRTLGLIGPDGVGKSTLLGLIAGVRRVQTGSIEVLGGDIAQPAHRHAVCTRIAYMPQGLGRNLYPALSVSENIDFFGRLFGQSAAERRERIQTLLAATGLDPFPDRPAGKLSGGMRQKLGLCCALIHDPDLLILDEPTTGVDPLSRRQFWELIDHVRSRRLDMTVLVATAYIEEAERFDRLVVMDAGRVLASGTRGELKQRTGSVTLKDTFVALLPEAKRHGRVQLAISALPPSDGPPVIEAQGLTRQFGSFVAVDHVSFRIQRGEIFGFLGSNGCGKTTTMKMLTGLLPANSGEASLLGRPVAAADIETRRRVGYMSQGFSLYDELTVRRNLALHARLFRLPAERVASRVALMLERFELAAVADELPDALPLGIRQRLSLAVALIHEPEILILDEPTSGVDPIARDRFWQQLVALSREAGVTIFVSTHLMAEALRCDRISLMHAGRVLAIGTPEELRAKRGAATLDDAFVGYLREAAGEKPAPAPPPLATATASRPAGCPVSAGLGRLWAYARREGLELLRDRVRLAFALIGPLCLLLAFGYGISFDVENLRFAGLDRDRSAESRALLQEFEGSRYFTQQPPATDSAELEARLRAGELALTIELPPQFGRDLLREGRPQVALTLDGAMPFRAETARVYIAGVVRRWLAARTARAVDPTGPRNPYKVELRYRYNQAFLSVFAIVPGVIMLLLVLIPSMLTAGGVVRERETGSIANLYASPTRRLEFLLGKQLPYAALALTSAVSLILMAVLLFGVPIRGNLAALLLGVLLYVLATTAFGLVVSTFVRTQLAAIFASAILTVIPAVNFSGFLSPVAGLSGPARWIGASFPAGYFQAISVGTFTKGPGFVELVTNHLALAGFALLFIAFSRLLLAGQGR
jgi:ribosome-dependent ATPase